MKALLVYPRYPDTFWSLRHALRVTSKKAASPPLGLLTVGSLLPLEWEKKLVDMNVTTLTDRDIRWADYVFISAMTVQRQSVKEVVSRCKKLNAKTVAGGPLFTSEREAYPDINHLVLDEAEITLAPFLKDLANGNTKRVYTSLERPDMGNTPLPMWSLLDTSKYATLSIQYSRGCPFDCEFCNIAALYGHKVRTKGREQLLAELQALYGIGWRSEVFIVDDNFVGNKGKLKEEILPAMAGWQRDRRNPFTFSTQASVNLADDEELMRMMVTAGFNTVFVGIETPNMESLVECNKRQNENRDLVASVTRMQDRGLQVQAGLIVGFDSDPPSVFERQLDLVQKSGIVVAMVGLLNAPPGTRLHQRMERENRLLKDVSGDNTDCSMNFIPKMDSDELVGGYKHILTALYSPKQYYRRAKEFLEHHRSRQGSGIGRLHWWHMWTLIRCIWILGIVGDGRAEYWRFTLSTTLRRPSSLPMSVRFAIYGYHFWTVVRKLTAASA